MAGRWSGQSELARILARVQDRRRSTAAVTADDAAMCAGSCVRRAMRWHLGWSEARENLPDRSSTSVRLRMAVLSWSLSTYLYGLSACVRVYATDS